MKKIFGLIVAGLLVTSTGFAQSGATEDDPIDRTSYITNPSFENGTRGWTVTNLNSQSNTSFTYKSGTFYMEKWTSSGSVGSASAKQTVKALPVGVYKLTVAGQNLTQSSTEKQNTGANIVAAGESSPVYTPGDYTVTFKNLTGSVEIGFVATNASGNWIAVDNFRLYQTGDVEKSEVAVPLNEKIAEVEAEYDETKTGAADLLAEINKAKAMITDDTYTADDLADEIAVLDKALFAFRIANPGTSTGTAPQVTETNTYAPTGSTEVLIRASMRGSYTLERGVCWSTERMPTVLDNRTTECHSLNGYIFHIRDLEPATVYYVRPYVMNKSYVVAYGDEIKVVTHPKGTCIGTWDGGAPTAEANARCSLAIQQTIEYFNQWTGIRGFTLSGHYGSGTPTADCSYGGYMRIGPNASYQAIGTVLHETGHGVGVGTHWRWNNCEDTRENQGKYGKWLGREANEMLDFLENKAGDENCYLTGDAVHGWGNAATYDWFVNGADKDKHLELQYLGGCCLLYALFVDGLCPTSNHPNGLPGYTYNFDSDKKYYLMCKDAERGLGTGIMYARSLSAIGWKHNLTDETIGDECAWYMEFDASTGYYLFKNVKQNRYLTHTAGATNVTLKSVTNPSLTEKFQLMPDRTDVTISGGDEKITTHGYWITWYESGNKAMGSSAMGRMYGTIPQQTFDYSDEATAQQWIIISEDELETYKKIANILTGIESVNEDSGTKAEPEVEAIYNAAGILTDGMQPGLNIIKYNDGTTKKTYIK